MNPTWMVRLDAPGDGPRLAVKDCIDVEGLPTTAGHHGRMPGGRGGGEPGGR